MFNDEEIELTDDERAAFASLPRERVPGDLLEERIVQHLRTEGLFSTANTGKSRGNRFAFFALRAAAAVLLFAAGALTQKFLTSPSDNNELTPAPARSAEQKPLPAQRTEPSQVAQLELWI